MRHFIGLAKTMPHCIDLSVGEPDFCPAGHVLDAEAIEAAESGKLRYDPSKGLCELREVLAEKASNDYGWSATRTLKSSLP
jgi:aspartate/methionine/tyrosine aminotransferase